MTPQEELELARAKAKFLRAQADAEEEEEALAAGDGETPEEYREAEMGLPPEMGIPQRTALGFGNVEGLKEALKSSGIDDVRKGPSGLWEVKKGDKWYSDETGPGYSDLGPSLPAIAALLTGAITKGRGASLSKTALGAGALGGIGEGVRTIIGDALGLVKNKPLGERASEAAGVGLINATGEFIAPGVAALPSKVVSGVKPFLSSITKIPIEYLDYASSNALGKVGGVGQILSDKIANASKEASALGEDILSSIKGFKKASSSEFDAAQEKYLQQYGDTPANRQEFQNTVDRILKSNRLNAEESGILQDLVNPKTTSTSPVFSAQKQPTTTGVTHTVPGYDIHKSVTSVEDVGGTLPGYQVTKQEPATRVLGNVEPYTVPQGGLVVVSDKSKGVTTALTNGQASEYLANNPLASIIDVLEPGTTTVIPGKDITETYLKDIVLGKVGATKAKQTVVGKELVGSSPAKTIIEEITNSSDPLKVVDGKEIQKGLFDPDPLTGQPNRQFTVGDMMTMYNRAGEHANYGVSSDVVSAGSKQLRDQAVEFLEGTPLRDAQKKYARGVKAQKVLKSKLSKTIPETFVESLSKKTPLAQGAILQAVEEIDPALAKKVQEASAREAENMLLSQKMGKIDPNVLHENIASDANLAERTGLINIAKKISPEVGADLEKEVINKFFEDKNLSAARYLYPAAGMLLNTVNPHERSQSAIGDMGGLIIGATALSDPRFIKRYLRMSPSALFPRAAPLAGKAANFGFGFGTKSITPWLSMEGSKNNAE